MNQVIAYSMILLLISAAGGGFYLGMEYAKRPDKTADLMEQVEKQSAEIERLRSDLQRLELAQGSRTYAAAPSKETAPSSDPVDPMALRAEQETIVFTDRQGRELVASIVEVGADSSQVKRSSDGRVFQLKHADLIAQDREFMQYLYAQKKQASPEMPNKSDIDWDAIFGKN